MWSNLSRITSSKSLICLCLVHSLIIIIDLMGSNYHSSKVITDIKHCISSNWKRTLGKTINLNRNKIYRVKLINTKKNTNMLSYIGYHLSVTKLNGLSPNFLFKYHQHKSFFHHQIKLVITKFNAFSPNKLIFESPNILNSHQK